MRFGKVLAVVLLACCSLSAQINPNKQAGVYIASAYSYDIDATFQLGLGPYTFPITGCLLPLGNNRNINPFNTNASVLISDGNNSETVSFITSSTNTGYCVLKLNTSHSHLSYHLKSGTFGLQEAINDATSLGGGVVVIDASWTSAGGVDATITNANGNTNVAIQDNRAGGPAQWFWNGANYIKSTGGGGGGAPPGGNVGSVQYNAGGGTFGGSLDWLMVNHTLTAATGNSILDLALAPSASGFRLPLASGASPTVAGQVAYDLTLNLPKFGINGSTIAIPVNTTATASNWVTSYNAANGTFTKAQPAFTDISGSVTCGQMPALTGDATTSAGSCATVVGKLNGGAFTGSNGDVVKFGASNTPADAGFLAANVALKNTANAFVGGLLQDLSADDFLQPIHTSDPASCTPGQIYFNSTSPAMKFCSATNTWTPVGGTVSWSSLQNPSGTLTLSMGSNLSTFNTTTALSQFFKWANTTAAILATSQGSPILSTCGQAFHGSASVEDCLTMSELPGNGNDAAITFNVGHTGSSTGVVTTQFPGPLAAGSGGGVGGAITLPEGTAVAGSSGNDVCYADSTAHRAKCSFNNDTAIGLMRDSSTSTTATQVVHATGTAGIYAPSAIAVADLPAALGSATTVHNVEAPLLCADSSGSGSAQVCNTSPSFTPATGDCMIYTTTTSNTGASLTINWNALGAKNVAKNQTTTVLAANDIRLNTQLLMCYDGTNIELEGQLGNAPAGSGTVNAGTATHLAYYATSSSAISDAGADFTFDGTHTWAFGASGIFKIPVGAGLTSAADGQMAYDSTGKLTHVRTNGADSSVIAETSTSTTTTQVLHATATAGIGAFSALASGDMPSSVCQPGSFSAQTDAATVTWAIGSAICANASLTFTVHSGSRTLNLTGLVNGGSYVIWLKQDATGGEGLTLGTGCTWKVINGGAGAVSLSSSANAIDVLSFTYDGTNCYANLGKNYS